jgi:glycosyltransferase involved in cell wall biosynthesis
MKTLDSQDILLQDFPAARPSLRLAVVTETWPPEVNGVALTLSRLVQGLCERNHEVQLVRPRQVTGEHGAQDPGFEEKLMRGMPIPRYPQLKLGLPGRKALMASWALQRPDLVHIATEGPLGWSALKAARQLRIPVTSDFRTNFHSYSRHYGLGWLRRPIAAYLRKFHNQTLCTMVPTRALCAELLSQGFQRLQVVARGVDTRLFDPGLHDHTLRAHWGAGPGDLVLLVVGRLAPEKNLTWCWRLSKPCRRFTKGCAWSSWATGRCAMRWSGAAPARFVGSQTQAELARSYASADLLLFPSLTETFGNVTLEALASGLPVLAYACAAAAEWVHTGVNGWTVPPGDPRAFVQTAVDLAREPRRVAQAAAHARASVEPLDWQRITLQVEALFMRAMELQRSGLPPRVAAAPQPAF